MSETDNNNTENLLKIINKAVLNKKGLDLINIDLKNVHNTVCKYFVICHANSDVQANAIAGEVLRYTKQELKEKVYNKEGFNNSHWILLDYVDVVVHIFQKEYRDYYSLESLWADAPQKKINY